jgi:ferredoxin-NADP reductase/phenylpropionate dioxygenase-like ring-hydroxylating dioxygenase large terminal subunit
MESSRRAADLSGVRMRDPAALWYPIAAANDLPFRHIFHGQLLGRELAVWRADDGYLNVWENRCLHRGSRLSIGVNDGRELKCQYHGWRYANRTAGCTYIPAHPADAPARTIRNRTFPAEERYGLVWSSLNATEELPKILALEQGSFLTLRGIAVNGPAVNVIELLTKYQFQPVGALEGNAAEIIVEDADERVIVLHSRQNGVETVAVFFVQPVDSRRCVIRGVLNEEAQGAERIAVLRHHNERLSTLRDAAERRAEKEPLPPEIQPVYERVAPELAEMPELKTSARKAALRVQIARKWTAADGIAAFELRPLSGLLPSFQPGAHIDVHLSNGQIRQYSLINGPGESGSYVIGVKREALSRGGSQLLYDSVREGDVLAISEPRNNFPLRRDALRTIFIAGGIGITPLLAMAQTLQHAGLSYELNYFAENRERLAFPERLALLGDRLKTHLALPPDAAQVRIRAQLSAYRPHMQVYICGPDPMLDAARRIAAEQGWPETAVHFEYFKNTRVIDASTTFEVALARSCITLTVPSGKSILEIMRENGLEIASSCEQGACGTCAATVLEGEPIHQDVYLSDAEKLSGTKIMTCVSRAKSARLVLDL